MKKVIAIALLMTSTAPAFADGIYEGVWQTALGSYSTINQNGTAIVATALYPETLSFEAFQGVLTGSTATLQAVLGGASSTLSIEFSSANNARITVVACSPLPGYVCLVPNGTAFDAVKIF